MFLKINKLFFTKSSLSLKIMTWFLILSLIPLIVFAVYSYNHNSNILKESVSKELKYSSELQKRYIHNWFSFRKADVLNWAQTFDEKNIFNIYENYPYIYNIFKISKDGNISFSYKKERDFGTNLLDGPYSKTRFAETFRQTLKNKKIYFSDLEYYEPSNKNITGFILAPIFAKDGAAESVFAVQIKLDNIFSIFEEQEAHNSYLVGADGFLRTNISDDKLALKHKINLEILKNGDISNEKFFITREDVNIYGVNWILINEYSYDDLYESKKVFLRTLLLFLLITTIIIYLVSRYISSQITKPIYSLIKASQLISKGDYTKRINIDTNDEIEQLANSFNLMTLKLSESLKEIKDQKDSFESLYQKSTDGILLFEDGKFIDCNESVVKMLGYTNKEMFLKTNPSKLSPTYQPDGEKSFDKANKMINLAFIKGSHTLECVHTKADGKDFWVEVVLTKIVQNSKDIIHIAWRDIEKRKQIELKLEELTRDLERRIKYEVARNLKKDKHMLYQSRLAQMGEMISMIAHQWRQPLSAISSTSIDLKMKIELETFDLEDEKGRKEHTIYFKKGLDDIENLTQNLTTTINDFKDFYKPNKEKKLFSINDTVLKALKIIERSLIADKVKVIKECNSNNLYEIFDSEVMQVILNIINNAQDNFKYQKTENPMIKITTQDIEDGFKIEIYDNGGGISDKIIDKIFDPYFSTKHDKNGTGLGLYMSKMIIEDHHFGKLYVKNIVGAGICFSIEIQNQDIEI